MIAYVRGTAIGCVPGVDLEKVTNSGAVVVLYLGKQFVGFGFFNA